MYTFSVEGKKANDRKNALDNGLKNSLKHKEDMKQVQENRLNRI